MSTDPRPDPRRRSRRDNEEIIMTFSCYYSVRVHRARISAPLHILFELITLLRSKIAFFFMFFADEATLDWNEEDLRAGLLPAMNTV